MLVFLPLAAIGQDNAEKLPLLTTSPDSTPIIKEWIAAGESLVQKDTATARHFLRQAAECAKRQQRPSLAAKAYYTLGEQLFQQRDFDKAINAFTAGRNAVLGTADTASMAQGYLGIGKTQFHRGNYSLSIKNLLSAVERSEQAGATQTAWEANDYVALLYNVFQQSNLSIQYAKRSMAIKKSLGDRRGCMQTADKLSYLFYEENQYDSSLHYAALAAAIARQEGLTMQLRLSELSSAASLIRLQKLPAAAKLLDHLAQRAKDSTDKNFLVRFFVLKGNYFLARNDLRQGHLFYEKALQLADSAFSQELQLLIYKNIACSYYERAAYRTAFDYYKMYNEQLASLYTQENIIRLGKLEVLMKKISSSDEIQYLHNENKLKELKLMSEAKIREALQREKLLNDSLLRKERLLSEALARENSYQHRQLKSDLSLRQSLHRENLLQQEALQNEKKLRLMLIAGLGVISLLGSVIFLQYRKQRKKNSIIGKQADELQILLKEVHHRVKNNLQLISSLLDLQSLSMKEPSIVEAVKEGKNRVQSMALIHQNLYSEGNLKGIEIHHYIQHLAANLFDSYNIKKERIKLVAEIEPLNLDVDTALPIGLIINELISNSLKYAFRGKSEGELFIKLERLRNHLFMQVKDNGIGFPDNWMDKKQAFGYKIIQAFSRKLKAKLDIRNDHGADITLLITKYKLTT